ncbi:hypothetical protein ACQR35_05105 [Pseudarthrobacter sp. J1738]|uniref:hypothetical protein n=1 Tax=unclassified Pseudarthrobacter TaxID=2647000 RepID=UPI003D2840F5
MFDQDPAVIDWLVNLDAPGGTIDSYIESMQLHHRDLTSNFQRGQSRTANLESFMTYWRSTGIQDQRVVALVSAPSGAPSIDYVALNKALSPNVHVLAFVRNYQKSEFPQIFVQGCTVDLPKEFALKIGGHMSRLIRAQPEGSPFNPPSVPFPTTRYDYVGIDSYSPVVDEVHTLSVDLDGVKFDMLSDLRSRSRKLVVIGQSALTRSQVNLPLFHRWSWTADLDGSALVLNDPTLYLDDALDAGWWIGTRERDYAREMSAIVAKTASSLGLSNEDVIFYGGSAGGFASFHMAACLPGSSVIADIPQTNLRLYHVRKAVDHAAKAGLGFESIEHVDADYLHRIDVIERFVHEQHVPDFLYLQNNRDQSHLMSQYVPFVTRLAELQMKHSWARSRSRMEIYSAWSKIRGGHFPLNRHDTMQYLNNWKKELVGPIFR